MRTENLTVDFNSVYLYSDQPATCPCCGSRTDILLNMQHTANKTTVQECLKPNCNHIFVMVEDTVNQ